MRWQVLVGLVLCNIIWASVPMVGKLTLEVYEAEEAAFLRNLGALVMILILSSRSFCRPPRLLFAQTKRLFFSPLIFWLILIGSTTFFLSPLAQYWGLEKSTASANALIVAIEPIFTAMLAWILLKEKMNRVQWLGFVIAGGGFLLLSNVDPTNFFGSFALFNVANLFFALNIPCEAVYTVTCRKIAGVEVGHRELYGFALLAGTAGLFLLLMIKTGLPNFSKMTLKVFVAVVWLGPVSSALTYLYWSRALQKVPVAAVALTLFIQPLLGAVLGRVFLYEVLNFWQFTGAAAILSALVLQTYYYRRKRSLV